MKKFITTIFIISLTACTSNSQKEVNTLATQVALQEHNVHTCERDLADCTSKLEVRLAHPLDDVPFYPGFDSDIKCHFESMMEMDITADENYNDTVNYNLVKQESSNEMGFIFEEDSIILKGNGGKSNVVATKIGDNGEFVFVEEVNGGYVSVYSIFLDQEIGIWTKTNELFGPYSFTSVGKCYAPHEGILN